MQAIGQPWMPGICGLSEARVATLGPAANAQQGWCLHRFSLVTNVPDTAGANCYNFAPS